MSIALLSLVLDFFVARLRLLWRFLYLAHCVFLNIPHIHCFVCVSHVILFPQMLSFFRGAPLASMARWSIFVVGVAFSLVIAYGVVPVDAFGIFRFLEALS